jgi:RNA polymerase sigma factor (sigma-70 family)
MDTALSLDVNRTVGDTELVAQACNGSRCAFDALFERHKPFIYNVCYRMLGSAEDAIDATQNAFVQAYKGIGRFKGQSAFRTWLYRIAINECSAILRKEQRRNALTIEIFEDRKPETSDDRVWEAVLSLPHKLRSVIVLFYFQKLSSAEAAKVLGCSDGAFRVRLHRAREVFKKVYEESER